jgi:glyoxylase-like metal-dependent hydrolase (beta-lactamase superfamily II)
MSGGKNQTMAVLQLGNIIVQRIVEHDVPVYLPWDMFNEATPEAVAPYREWLEPRALCPESGRMIMPVQSYLVRTRHHCILIDTCCGHRKSYAEPPEWHRRSNENWLRNLEATGVHVEDVDYVFCTHLHSDHCGWNTRLVDGRWIPTFPNARYVFARDEYLATQAEGSEIFDDNVLPIMEAKQAVLVDLDYALDDEIWLEPTVGHTAGHVAIHLKSGRHHAAMCGDLVHSPLQLAKPEWSCNSDYDLAASARTRKAFLNAHCESDTIVLTAHFPSPSIGHIIARGDTYDFRYA